MEIVGGAPRCTQECSDGLPPNEVGFCDRPEHVEPPDEQEPAPEQDAEESEQLQTQLESWAVALISVGGVIVATIIVVIIFYLLNKASKKALQY